MAEPTTKPITHFETPGAEAHARGRAGPSTSSSRSSLPALGPFDGEDAIEISVVIPCLNEADTIEVCIVKAKAALQESEVVGEVIVADNNSSDDSRAIAARCGARVVTVTEKGYGSALMGGIEAAKGKYIIMGDADDSYDFSEIPKFAAKLRQGFDLVQGCRLWFDQRTVSYLELTFMKATQCRDVSDFLIRDYRW